MRELFVDNFAGGGGASTGIELAIGKSVDVAINHDPEAIVMHKANHPYTKHYCEDVWTVDPIEACNGNPVALAWFSPDCTHFSRAKGGKPVDKNIRGLAWVSVKWAFSVKPRVIMMENVPEIQTWGPLDEDNKPIKERMGETFEGFVLALTKGIPRNHPAFSEMCESLQVSVNSEIALACEKGLGYTLDYKVLKSCDYGAPTSRTRFYMIARCDGKQIVWPKPTHGPQGSKAVKEGRLLPYHTAAECIDWSIEATSIFERKKPLAENTLKRIAKGIQKFVIDNPEPFIVTVNHSGESFRGQSIDKPLKTVTAKHGYGIVTPTIMCNNTNNKGASADDPLPTITTGNRNYLVSPTITAIGQQSGGDRTRSADNPLSTVVSKNEHILVAPTLIQYHSETSKDEVRGQEIDEPLMTQDTSNRYALSVANIMKNYGGGYKGHGSAVDDPLGTITAHDHNSLVTAHILMMRNNQYGQSPSEPLSTIACSGAHHAEVQAFLMKYNRTGGPKDANKPIDTITAKDRFAVVTIHGEEYIITDIKMRMLQPRELFNCQGFPNDYIIDPKIDGKEYPKYEQTRKCGNAVTPQVPEALVRANLPEHCKFRVREAI